MSTSPLRGSDVLSVMSIFTTYAYLRHSFLRPTSLIRLHAGCNEKKFVTVQSVKRTLECHLPLDVGRWGKNRGNMRS